MEEVSNTHMCKLCYI